MKISERFVRFGLILMIAVSFYLTYLIWLGPTNRDGTVENQTDTEIQENLNYKEASDIFLPLRLARIQEDSAAETNTESLIRKVQEEVADARYTDGQIRSYHTREEFLEQSRMTDGIELAYTANMPITDYMETFHVNVPIEDQEAEGFSFFRVQLDFARKKIRLLNSQTQTILEATISSVTNIENTLEDNSAEWIDVFRDEYLSSSQFFTSEPVKLKMYSYISSTRPYTIFRDSFFSNPKNIRSSDGTANLNLYDGSESMTIQQNRQQVDFRGSVPLDEQFSIYETSYRYIRGLGTNYGSMRLFDQKEQMMDYRIFVEGFPIFSEQDEGRIMVQFSEIGQTSQANVEITANLNTIQVPIPSDQEVELPASYDVVQTLYGNGAEVGRLEAIIVGYSWKNLQDTGVVDLQPDWYIEYDDTWYSYEGLLKHLQESEEQ